MQDSQGEEKVYPNPGIKLITRVATLLRGYYRHCFRYAVKVVPQNLSSRLLTLKVYTP